MTRKKKEKFWGWMWLLRREKPIRFIMASIAQSGRCSCGGCNTCHNRLLKARAKRARKLK